MIKRAGSESSHRFRISRLFSASIVPAASLMSVPQHPGRFGLKRDAHHVTLGEMCSLQRFVLLTKGEKRFAVVQADVVMRVSAEIDDGFEGAGHLRRMIAAGHAKAGVFGPQHHCYLAVWPEVRRNGGGND